MFTLVCGLQRARAGALEYARSRLRDTGAHAGPCTDATSDDAGADTQTHFSTSPEDTAVVSPRCRLFTLASPLVREAVACVACVS